ncbi:hypothetical protein BDZ89DRAFT_1072784 [Hymenopellis radicata]|nr:hypothetical protein BDZ89DRAFT_1072784 [Hymenopellis radicata]
MSSASSSRSSSPASDAAPVKSKSEKAKGKKKDDGPKNEGDDQNWAYQPPDGAVALDNPKNASLFDWDALEEDEDLDIWLIRVPDSIKPKHLENVSIELTTDDSSSHVGHISKKNAEYDIWSVGAHQENDIGAEVARLSCLLPRKSTKSEMYLAPRAIARRLVITASPAKPATPDTAVPTQNPPRPVYPKEVLKHSFKPYGAGLGAAASEDNVMEVDEPPVPPKKGKDKGEKPASKAEGKSRKRKDDGSGEAPTPKKPKKSKH